SSVATLLKRPGTAGEKQAAQAAFDRMVKRAKDEINDALSKKPKDERIKKFAEALDRAITSANTEPPPLQPRFRQGQWVFHLTSGGVAKIDDVILRNRGQLSEVMYNLNFGDRFLLVPEKNIRRATQEEVDAYLASRAKKREAKFKVGDWVVHKDDGKIGRIILTIRNVNGFEYDVDVDNDSWPEEYLRPATDDEIRKAKAQNNKSSSSNTGSNALEIVSMARYVNAAEKSNKVYGIVRHNGEVYTFWGGYNKALKTKKQSSINEAESQFYSKTRKGYVEQSKDQISKMRDWVMEALEAEFAKR